MFNYPGVEPFECTSFQNLRELLDVKEYAARIHGRKTDIMTRDGLPA
jgi:hypothetical protein